MSIRTIQIDTIINSKTEVSTTLLGTKFKLGPVNCTIEGLGFKTSIEKKNNGNLGPVDVSLGLIYPKGIAIGFDTDTFRGGGYLFFDRANNRYAGAIELSFKGKLSLNAIGLLTTRLPDGSKGTSLLIIINTTFPKAIPLAYGFNLAGVGGIIGLHRTVNVDKLAGSVTSGTIDNILFPTNVIYNISQIISDLREIFPPKRNQFLIGPMAMITWGSPALLNIELGIIIEFDKPVRIVILGLIKAGLPTTEDALVKLQVNFVGVIDFDKEMISFDAALFDSRIVAYTLEGQMAFRMSWGKNPDFALAVGGFHPAYTPAKHLRFFEMKRLTISLMGGNPRLTLTSYYALTTNSVQFGAAIDFYFKIYKFKVVGGFGYDVLFMFNPFQFIAEVRAGLAVKWGKKTLLSISLKFTLSGPSPWVASGTGRFKVWILKYHINFHKTFGERKNILLPDINVLPLVIAALENSSNWQSKIPANRFDLVVMRKDDELDVGEILFQTFGSLTVRQKVVPLGIRIVRFGNSKPVGETLFEITKVSLGTSTMQTSSVNDDFVPSTYKDMNDTDKLTAPSFERMSSGILARGNNEFCTQQGIDRVVEYEVIISDANNENRNPPLSDLTSSGTHQEDTYIPTDVLFNELAQAGTVADSVLSERISRQLLGNETGITVKQGGFVLVAKEDLIKVDGEFDEGTKAEANEALLKVEKEHKSMQERVMIIPRHKARKRESRDMVQQ
jgi:hypothetical protein